MNNNDDLSYTYLLKQWVAGGSANAITSAILNPMDVAKTRLQSHLPLLSKESYSMANIPNRGLVSVLLELYKEQGLLGVWRPGLLASMIREMINSGARAGFYTSVRDFMIRVNSGESDGLLPKICAALTTGTFGAVISNPIDVIKIRLMANPQLYPSTIKAFPIIMKNEGITGLFKGVYPSTLRGAFIAVGELASYDHSKLVLRKYLGFSEGAGLHICSSLITGLIATTVAAPFDMLKVINHNVSSSVSFVDLLYSRLEL